MERIRLIWDIMAMQIMAMDITIIIPVTLRRATQRQAMLGLVTHRRATHRQAMLRLVTHRMATIRPAMVTVATRNQVRTK